jgi:hypothetical protein
MRTPRAGIKIGAKMELRRQEDHSEDQRAEPHSMGAEEHLVLRRSLGWNGCGVKQCERPMGNFLQLVVRPGRPRCYATLGAMQRGRSILGRTRAQRALAIFSCAVLLYFAGGGSLLHHHTSGPETPCHICQSMHVPVLAAAALDLVAAPQLIARFSSLPQDTAPSHSFSLHRASRAPPSA